MPLMTLAASRRPGHEPDRALWGSVQFSSRDQTEVTGFGDAVPASCPVKGTCVDTTCHSRRVLDRQADVCAPASLL